MLPQLIFYNFSKIVYNFTNLQLQLPLPCLSLSISAEQLSSHGTHFHGILYLSVLRKFVEEISMEFYT